MNENLQGKDQQIFWGEIAPCSHLLQIYESDDIFINTLEGYVKAGFDAGDSVIIIATTAHQAGLEKLLANAGRDIENLKATGQYVPVEVEEALAAFMVDDRPDPKLFRDLVVSLLAKTNGRPARAFGEMVAILWEKGLNGATVQLEHMWNEFCKHEVYSLFCAYPKSGFTNDANLSIQSICDAHTKVLSGEVASHHHIHYINGKFPSQGGH